MSDELELRAAWEAVSADSARSWEVFDDLIGRHRQPHRRYHGVRHVVWVLRHVRALEAAIPDCGDGHDSYDAGAVSAAAFFHDAIYDPSRGDNEERSAVLAEHQLASLEWDPKRSRFVGELVRATASHVSGHRATAGLEALVLLDADLAVLGSQPSAYSAYATGVRVEYRHLADDEWSAGRAAVLTGLLERDYLYGTEPARTWWEARARANLAAELASLRVG
jgi:predicted metal-dependent HD superfamily phosphohydrolase